MNCASALRFNRARQNLITPARGLLPLLFVAICLSLAQSIAAVAQTNASMPLTPAAQEALDKGIIAARVPDYLLAIRYFDEARKLAPQAPVVFLNMGLAESRIPGRELRAMAWFGAYLSAYPDAPNGAAVKEQIAVLSVRNQSNILRFVKTVQDAANALPEREKPPGIVMNFNQGGALHHVATLWARSGDSAAALQAVTRIQDVYWRGWAQGAVGLTRLNAGDKAGAREFFTLATRTSEGDRDEKNNTKLRVAEAQARMGDFADATKTAENIRDAWASTYARVLIANWQTGTGDRNGARQTLAMAIQMADHIKDAREKSDVGYNIAMALAHAGDADAALRIVQWAPDGGGLNAAAVQMAIVVTKIKAQAESGDTKGALLAAEQLGNKSGSALQKIAEVQTKLADFPGALKTIDRIQDSDIKRRAREDIDEAQARTSVGRPVAVAEWIAKIDTSLNHAMILDLAEGLKSLPKLNAQQTFDILRDLAGELIDRQQIVEQMIKRQIRK